MDNKITNSEDLLNKIDARDKALKTLILLLVLVAIALSIFNNIRLRQIINENQRQTAIARQANLERQDAIIQHLDCVFLLSKKYPSVNFQALNYTDSQKYLNECVKTK